MQVRFTDLAVADIENIKNHIAQDNPLASSRMAVAIVAMADRLSVNPRLGRLGAMQGTFELTVKPYILVYAINRAEIVVLRIWHSRQKRPGT